MDFFGIQNVAQFVAGETVETGVVGIQFGAELGAADFVPAEGFAVVAHVFGEGTQVVGGVDEFEHARGDEVNIGGGVCAWRQDRELLGKPSNVIDG